VTLILDSSDDDEMDAERVPALPDVFQQHDEHLSVSASTGAAVSTRVVSSKTSRWGEEEEELLVCNYEVPSEANVRIHFRNCRMNTEDQEEDDKNEGVRMTISEEDVGWGVSGNALHVLEMQQGMEKDFGEVSLQEKAKRSWVCKDEDGIAWLRVCLAAKLG